VDAKVTAAIAGFVRLRLDLKDAAAEAKRYGVNAVPVVLILAPDGKEIARKDGYQSPEQFLEFVGQVPRTK